MLVQLLKVLGSMTAHHIALLIDDVRPRAHERLGLHGFKLLLKSARHFLFLNASATWCWAVCMSAKTVEQKQHWLVTTKKFNMLRMSCPGNLDIT